MKPRGGGSLVRPAVNDANAVSFGAPESYTPKMCSHSDADKLHLALQMHFTAFNTVVTMRYALCIKYNHYAQPQKCVTKVATNYMAIPPQEFQISIQQNSKAQYEVGK